MSMYMYACTRTVQGYMYIVANPFILVPFLRKGILLHIIDHSR